MYSLGCASKAASNSCSANQPKANLFSSWFSICSSTTREENSLFLTTVQGTSHQFQQQKASDPFSSALLHPTSFPLVQMCPLVPYQPVLIEALNTAADPPSSAQCCSPTLQLRKQTGPETVSVKPYGQLQFVRKRSFGICP